MKKQQKPESTTTSSLDEDDGLTPEQRRNEWMHKLRGQATQLLAYRTRPSSTGAVNPHLASEK